MANSWINAAYRLGFELALACPEGYDPDPAILARAQGGSERPLVRDPREAAEGAHVVNTDVWASMGQEEEQEEREKAFAGYTVDATLMKRADARRDLPALPAGAPRRRSDRRGDRRSAEPRVGRGREPPAHPEGDHGGAHRERRPLTRRTFSYD